MKKYAKAALGALMLAGASLAMTAPASAYVDVGVSFGFGGPGWAFGDPCDYYDYYDAPPPWGLPPDYCDYPVYFEPVFFDNVWYRGPIYYRWNHGRRLFWLHGGWRADGWRGPRPGHINWDNRGGWNHGFRPGVNVRGFGGRGWHGGDRSWHGAGDHLWHGGGNPSWHSGDHPWGGGNPGGGSHGGFGHGGMGGGNPGGGSHSHH